MEKNHKMYLLKTQNSEWNFISQKKHSEKFVRFFVFTVLFCFISSIKEVLLREKFNVEYILFPSHKHAHENVSVYMDAFIFFLLFFLFYIFTFSFTGQRPKIMWLNSYKNFVYSNIYKLISRLYFWHQSIPPNET